MCFFHFLILFVNYLSEAIYYFMGMYDSLGVIILLNHREFV